MSYSVKSLKEYRKLLKPISCFIMKVRCSLGNFHAPAFVADFSPVASEFQRRTQRQCLRSLDTTDKKSSHRIKYRKLPREHQKTEEDTAYVEV